MLLRLSSDNIEHLKFLKSSADQVIHEFGAISLQFLVHGINPKIFKVAAQKLEVDVDVVEKAVIGLMHLFSEAAKHKLKDGDLFDSLIALEFSKTSAEILENFYSQQNLETRTVRAQGAPSLPSYEDLEWRLNVRLATRSLHHQVKPTVLLKLCTADGDKKEQAILQADPVNLLHMTRVLEDALEELKSNHVRRIVRTIT